MKKGIIKISFLLSLLLPYHVWAIAIYNMNTNELTIPALHIVSGGNTTDTLQIGMLLQTSIEDVFAFSIESIGTAATNEDMSTFDVDSGILSIPRLAFMLDGEVIETLNIEFLVHIVFEGVLAFSLHSVSSV
jgi:hypothetical protein